MLGPIINLLYPSICRICSKKIDDFNRNICPYCVKKIKERLPPFCAKCGRQLRGYAESIYTCADCGRDAPHFDRAWSACCYEDTLKNLIHDFKYKKITSLSKDFTALTVNFMKKYNAGKDCQMVISVPMHPDRLFKREINHSDILARDLGRALKIPYSKNILMKIKNTSLQSKLKREARMKNLSSSFSLKNSLIVLDKNILLVDDLFTTGSTVNECSKVLKDAGARYVEVITLARGDSV